MTKQQLKDKWTAHRVEVQTEVLKANGQVQLLAARAQRTKREDDRAKLRQVKALMGQRVAQINLIDLLLKDVAKW